jgi:hypothetical protein
MPWHATNFASTWCMAQKDKSAIFKRAEVFCLPVGTVHTWDSAGVLVSVGVDCVILLSYCTLLYERRQQHSCAVLVSAPQWCMAEFAVLAQSAGYYAGGGRQQCQRWWATTGHLGSEFHTLWSMLM